MITNVFIPRSTQPPPTVGHKRGSCRAVSPQASPGRPWCRGRCRPSCPGPARASSNSELDETGNPPRRSLSTRSSCSPPIWKTSNTSHNVLLSTFCFREMFLQWPVPGLTFSPNAEVVDRLRSRQRIAVHIVHLNAVIANTCHEGLWHSWIVSNKRGKLIYITHFNTRKEN